MLETVRMKTGNWIFVSMSYYTFAKRDPSVQSTIYNGSGWECCLLAAGRAGLSFYKVTSYLELLRFVVSDLPHGSGATFGRRLSALLKMCGPLQGLKLCIQTLITSKLRLQILICTLRVLNGLNPITNEHWHILEDHHPAGDDAAWLRTCLHQEISTL